MAIVSLYNKFINENMSSGLKNYSLINLIIIKK